jgi:hypothetical protein
VNHLFETLFKERFFPFPLPIQTPRIISPLPLKHTQVYKSTIRTQLTSLLSHHLGSGVYNAALTDNGNQVCTIQNEIVGLGTKILIIGSDSSTTAEIEANNVVYYSQLGFRSPFQTVILTSQDGPFDPVYTYWTINVWSC